MNEYQKKHGVGLGLNLCSKILTRIGKRDVLVFSKVGEGTAFTIYIDKQIQTALPDK
jgi:signal transduction histidine kinase